MEAPGGEPGYPHAGWVGPFFSDELGAFKQEEQLAAEILLLGRKTYESFYGAWPQREGAMADKINTMRKVVASTTLGSSEWENTTVIESDLEAAVRALKEEDGSPILVAGSRAAVRGPPAAGLVDEVHLQVFPLVLGSGIRVFPETTEPIRLEHAASRPVDNGVVLQTYRLQS